MGDALGLVQEPEPRPPGPNDPIGRIETRVPLSSSDAAIHQEADLRLTSLPNTLEEGSAEPHEEPDTRDDDSRNDHEAEAYAAPADAPDPHYRTEDGARRHLRDDEPRRSMGRTDSADKGLSLVDRRVLHPDDDEDRQPLPEADTEDQGITRVDHQDLHHGSYAPCHHVDRADAVVSGLPLVDGRGPGARLGGVRGRRDPSPGPRCLGDHGASGRHQPCFTGPDGGLLRGTRPRSTVHN